MERFMAEPSLIAVIDTFGIELLHPRREGRSPRQIERKGKSNWRWIVGGKLCLLLNHLGLVVGWDCDTTSVYDGSAFQSLVDGVADQMLVFSDTGFAKRDWHPSNLKTCKRGQWNTGMLAETVLSMLTTVCHFKKVGHRVWEYFKSRVGYTRWLCSISWFNGTASNLLTMASFIFLSGSSVSRTRTIGYYPAICHHAST
jgi:hypothetical protein